MPRGSKPGERRGGLKKARSMKDAANEIDYKFLDLHSKKITAKIKEEAARAAERGEVPVNAHRTQKIIATHLRQIIATMPRAVDIMRYVCKTHIDNFQRAEDKGSLDMESLERAAYWAERIAPYETPKLQAVLAATAAVDNGDTKVIDPASLSPDQRAVLRQALTAMIAGPSQVPTYDAEVEYDDDPT
jgi:hypothetical protein